jgi:hypothetical protein
MPNFYQWIERLAVSTLVHVLFARRIGLVVASRLNEPLGFAESMARILITCLVSNYPQAPFQRDRPQARRQDPFEIPGAVPIVPAMLWEVTGHPHLRVVH